MERIKIVREPSVDKPYIVIWKPKNLPSAPLNENDKENALSQAGELYPELYNVVGRKNIEYGLLHRLDTATDGLLVIALNQDCYDFILNEQKEGRFIKYYKACCNIDYEKKEGFPPYKEIIINEESTFSVSSYFRAYGIGKKEVRPVTKDSGKAALKKLGKLKEYTTEVHVLEKKKDKCLVECKILEGYRHQVRCHLSWIGLPIVGDKIYNKKNAENIMKFSATKVCFEYPRGDLNSHEIALTWT